MAKTKKGSQGAITTAAHKARRIAKEARRQARDIALRLERAALRRLGALRRIDKRITAAKSDADRNRLLAIRLKVAAAMTAQAEAVLVKLVTEGAP